MRAGLIGHPVEHSISPDFQQAAFDALGIPARYERWDTEPARLSERIAGLRRPGFLGANVTVPYKEAVTPLLDSVSALARRVGAVNTVVVHDGGLAGDNTDVTGFRRALSETAGFAARGCHAFILGAGGVARAAVLALAADGAGKITLANRHRERAERLAAALRDDEGPLLAVADWGSAAALLQRADADILVNCTTVGLGGSAEAGESPVPAGALQRDTFVCDVIANPRRTPLLLAAEAAGCRTLGGLPMLVLQGAAAFEIWTGREAPVNVMRAAAEAAIDRIERGA